MNPKRVVARIKETAGRNDDADYDGPNPGASRRRENSEDKVKYSRPTDKLVVRMLRGAKSELNDVTDDLGYGDNEEFDDALSLLSTVAEDTLICYLVSEIRASKDSLGSITTESIKKGLANLSSRAFKRANALVAKDPKAKKK